MYITHACQYTNTLTLTLTLTHKYTHLYVNESLTISSMIGYDPFLFPKKYDIKSVLLASRCLNLSSNHSVYMVVDFSVYFKCTIKLDNYKAPILSW